MPATLPVALALLAEAAAYGPAAPASPKPVAKPVPAQSCETQQHKPDSREIVICAQRPNGYRLNPDILEARREARDALSRAARPSEWRHPQNDCTTVGPMGCRGEAAVNVVAAAITAVTIAKRLLDGKEIASVFETDPQPDEYHLYLAAKHRREAREAQAAIAAKVAADRAEHPAPSNGASAAKP